MLRDNLAGLIEPMVDRAGAHSLGGHPKEGQTGGYSRSTELAIVALKRSWRQVFRWKTGRQAENGKWPGLEVTTAAHDSRAISTVPHPSHRTIDPQCLKKSPPRRGGIFALTKNVASPFHAEPSHKAGHQALKKDPQPCRSKGSPILDVTSRLHSLTLYEPHFASLGHGLLLNVGRQQDRHAARSHLRGQKLDGTDMGVESASIWGAKLNSISWPYLEVGSFGYDRNDDTPSPLNLEHFLNFEQERHRRC